MPLLIRANLRQTLSLNLNKTTRELEDFKLVMQTIATVQSTTLTNEQKIHEMQETFTILSEHRIMVRVHLNFRFIIFKRSCIFPSNPILLIASLGLMTVA